MGFGFGWRLPAAHDEGGEEVGRVRREGERRLDVVTLGIEGLQRKADLVRVGVRVRVRVRVAGLGLGLQGYA